MSEYKPIEKRNPGRIILSLLLVCVMVVTILVCGVLFPTAIAADLIFEVGNEKISSPATAAQLSAVLDANNPYAIEDEYGVVWGEQTQVDIFRSTYENGNHEITVAGRNNSKVIAPGTENTYSFAIRNSRYGAVDYKVMVEAFFTGLDGTDKVIPLYANLQGNSWMLGGEGEMRPVLELDGLEESATLGVNEHAAYTLRWQWPFEQDLDGDGSVDDGDALDTWLANQGDVALTIRITVLHTFRPIQYPPISDPVPPIFDNTHHPAYIYGFTDGTIRPLSLVTRAEVAAMIYRLINEETRELNRTDECKYPDVPEMIWYRIEATTLTKMGIFEGYPDGLFHGLNHLTRGEMAALLCRLSGIEVAHDGKTKFPDIEGHWAQNYIMAIEDKNWIEGYPNGNFGPNDLITRAEVATMLNRMLHRLPEELSDLHEDMLTWPDNMDTEEWYYIAMQEASNSHTYQRMLGTREKWIVLMTIHHVGEEKERQPIIIQ